MVEMSVAHPERTRAEVEAIARELVADLPREKEILVKVTVVTIYDEVPAWIVEGETEQQIPNRIIQNISCGKVTLRNEQILDIWVEEVELPEGALDFDD